MACILLFSSAVKVHDSQAYRKMDVTREHFRCILELREILLLFQTGFNLVSAAVVCGILETREPQIQSKTLTSPAELRVPNLETFG